MKYTQWYPGGVKASRIVLGSTYFGTETPQAQSFEILDGFFEIGGSFIDTARVYGDFQRQIGGLSEAVIGRWIKARGCRENVFLATKGGHPPLPDMQKGRLSRREVFQDIEESLKALQTEYVDLYWLHRDDTNLPVGEIVEVLDEVVASGKARGVGLSNWSAQRLAAAREYALEHGKAPILADQPQWALAHQELVEDPTLVQMNQGLYAFHRQSGMAAVPYSSQAKGFFIKLSRGESLTDKARRRFDTPQNLRIYDALLAISQRTGHTVGQLQLAYLLCQPFLVCPIVGVSKKEQIKDLVGAAEIELSAGDFQALFELTGL